MKNKGQEGYALIEFVAALGINAIIAAALFGIFFSVLWCSNRNIARMDLHYSARSSLQVMEHDLLGAKRFEVLNEGKVLKLVNADGETVRYYMENSQLYRDGSAKLPVAENAFQIKFLPNGNMLEINLSFQKGLEDFSLVTAVTPRINT